MNPKFVDWFAKLLKAPTYNKNDLEEIGEATFEAWDKKQKVLDKTFEKITEPMGLCASG